MSMPGAPSKVGKSRDIVWVRSITDLNFRGAGALCAGGTAEATKPAAAAPLKNPRRLSARCMVSWHPGTHMMGLLGYGSRRACPRADGGATPGDCLTR